MCPICNSAFSLSDGNELRDAFNFLKKYANPNPAVFLTKIALDTIRVGRIIYYDFSKIPKVDFYLYCENCGNYYLKCPECGNLSHLGTKGLLHPVKKDCPSCKKTFVYLEHQDSEDVIDHSQFL